MSTVTVRIREETHRSLKQPAERMGESMPEILTKAIEEYRRKHFLDGLTADFAKPSRGEIWLVEFNPTIGREQAGNRPARVVSVDALNQRAAEV